MTRWYSHTNGNAVASVYKKIRKSRRKHNRFKQLIIIVCGEINHFFSDILRHFVGHLGESCLGITISGRRIAVHRAEISVTIN